MGAGHVMRMIALAQAWSGNGGEVLFVSRITADPLRDRIIREGFGLVEPDGVHPEPGDADFLLSQTATADWIALDGYHFDAEYQQTIRSAGRRALVMDDVNDRTRYVASVLVNQNIDASGYEYLTESDTLILRGAKYALLRREFTEFPRSIRDISDDATNVLVTFGGADQGNMTAQALRALKETGNESLHVKVVVGVVNPHMDALAELTASLPFRCDLLHGVEDMPVLMDWADLAVSAAGSTCWELCYFGVPMLLRVAADNQQGIANSLVNTGVAIVVEGDVDVATLSAVIEDGTLRRRMSHAGLGLVDGRGAERLASLKRVLFLGYDESETRLIDELRKAGCVVEHSRDKVDSFQGYDFVVSYGYRHIIPGCMITSGVPLLNLHISYLPYNRGAHPNFWAFHDDTPKGVTIHFIDEGLDTGPIIAQREVFFDKGETTFFTTCARLCHEVEALFVVNIPAILSGQFDAVQQGGEGVSHKLADLPEFPGGWDADIGATLDYLKNIKAKRV